MTTTTTEQLLERASLRTEWLREFQEAKWSTRATFRELDNFIAACYTVGSDRLGDTLSDFVETLRNSVKGDGRRGRARHIGTGAG